MKVLVLSHRQVEQLLPMSECISVMEAAFIALARGEFHQPLRTIMRAPGVSGVMALMPTYRAGNRPLFGLKAICVMPGNAAIGKDAHQGGVLLFDGVTGELLSMANASAITAIRTAAVSGLATRLLAREDAGDLAIIGAGVQARTHLAAMACVRTLRRVRIAARSVESAARFSAEMQPQYSFPIEAAESSEAAVRGADIIVTATTTHEPVIKRAWISAGAHINAIGTFSPKAREIDAATMAAATLVTDRRESLFNEAGDYLLAKDEIQINDHSIAELGETLIGERAARSAPDEITLFKSLGLAIEDLAAAAYLLDKARQVNHGAWLEFE